MNNAAMTATALALLGFGGTAWAELPAAALAPVFRPQLANGLIVQLRDAPTHAQVAREQAQAADGHSARGQAHRERLQHVLQAASLDRAAIDVPSAPRIADTGSASQVLRFERMMTLDEARRLAKRLAARGDVLWAEPNTLERPQQSTSVSDPYYFANASNSFNTEGQWWLFGVNGASGSAKADRRRGVPDFLTAWGTFNGSTAAAVPVAVLDTGITPHADLAGRIGTGYDFVSTVASAGDGGGRDTDPTDPGDYVSSDDRTANPNFFASDCGATSSWHGTKIAGLIAALTNNNAGVAGANWNAVVLPVRVAGKCGAEVADIVDGIRWSAGLELTGFAAQSQPRARIINISFGGTADCTSTDEGRLYQQAIDAARAVGAVVVAAAGNEHTAPTRPANCSNVIGVGALNRDGFKATYSNFGSSLVISTVGGDPTDSGNWGSALGDSGLLTTSNGGSTTVGSATYTSVFGTSFSAPLVSAAISLMLGRNGALTADQIVAGLQASARPHVTSTVMAQCSDANPGRCICTEATCGKGILDVPRALAYAAAPSTTLSPVAAANIDSTDLTNAHTANTQDRSANPVVPTTPAGPCGRDNVCAGAMQPGWLLGLLAASGALLWGRRRRAAQ